MNTYAVIKLGSKQYKVTEGSQIDVEKLPGKVGDSLDIVDVLLMSTDGSLEVGTPFVQKAQVKATILEHKKGKKIRVAIYKAKSRYRKVKGHRQQLSTLKIEKISQAMTKSKIKEKSEKASSNKKHVSKK